MPEVAIAVGAARRVVEVVEDGGDGGDGGDGVDGGRRLLPRARHDVGEVRQSYGTVSNVISRVLLYLRAAWPVQCANPNISRVVHIPPTVRPRSLRLLPPRQIRKKIIILPQSQQSDIWL